jgi:hypothetical protein
MRLVHCLAFIVGLAIVAGCSSKTGGDIGELRGAPISLVEVSDLLRGGGANGQPATQLSDLEKNRKMYPRGYDAVRKGEIVVLWGTPMKGEGEGEKGAKQDLIAYENKVPQEGGFVLFSGGTIKKMTSAEFAAAPKSGKPSH